MPKFRFRVLYRWFRRPIYVLQIAVERERGFYPGDMNGDMSPPPSWNSKEILTTWHDADLNDTFRILTSITTGRCNNRPVVKDGTVG